MRKNNSSNDTFACRSVCLRSRFEENTISVNVSGENNGKDAISFPASGSDTSDLNRSAVNFSEAGVSETQQGSGEHEEVIRRVGSLVWKRVATPGRRWFSCRTYSFGKKTS